MKSTKTIYIILVFLLIISTKLFATEFTITLTITNKSSEWQKLFLKKGRILEIAGVDATNYQSIIITEGDGLILIPPKSTVKRIIKGICLHKGLKFAEKNAEIRFTPFTGNKELIEAGSNQKNVHKIVAFPRHNIVTVTGKGYSDSEKDGRSKDREEAIRNAMEDAARKSGIEFESEAILDNFKIVKDTKKFEVGKRSIFLKKIIHEEYNEKKGEYLFIGEFDIYCEPPVPDVY